MVRAAALGEANGTTDESRASPAAVATRAVVFIPRPSIRRRSPRAAQAGGPVPDNGDRHRDLLGVEGGDQDPTVGGDVEPSHFRVESGKRGEQLAGGADPGQVVFELDRSLADEMVGAAVEDLPAVRRPGGVSTPAIGSDAFQECDTVGITRSCTKHNELIMRAEDVPMAVRQAFHIATTGRPGPTLIDVPKDVLQNEMTWHWPTDDEVLASLPGYRPNVKGHPRMIKEAARLILASERPIIYAGGGILKSRAAESLRELAELTDCYVVTTLMARGAFPDDHPLCLGMPGMHGNATAVTSMQKSDLLIALGSRFDDRITGKVDEFAPDAKVIHVDIDPGRAGQGAPSGHSDRRRLSPT